ncbi:MAG: hypothetical protein J7K83_00620 [Candidatus Aenigmarchaeota archaeon]|nr:hypothetical protein [Candidatus Aenigmarchaeota archaeon]
MVEKIHLRWREMLEEAKLKAIQEYRHNIMTHILTYGMSAIAVAFASMCKMHNILIGFLSGLIVAGIIYNVLADYRISRDLEEKGIDYVYKKLFE